MTWWKRAVDLAPVVIFVLAVAMFGVVVGYAIAEERFEDATRVCRDLRG